jgi:splicing factor 3B subunit 5
MRDSYASYIGHLPLLNYIAIGLGETVERTRLAMTDKIALPVGPPPMDDDADEENGDVKMNDRPRNGG